MSCGECLAAHSLALNFLLQAGVEPLRAQSIQLREMRDIALLRRDATCRSCRGVRINLCHESVDADVHPLRLVTC